MRAKRTSKKEELLDATVRLVANSGAEAATIRAIAREAGVTDAAVYRHYESKDDLCWRAYNRIVEALAAEKRALVTSDTPIRAKLHEWVRLSYAYYDQNPAAIKFVLAMPLVAHRSGHPAVIGQGELFLEMIDRARRAGDIRPVAPEIALSHFVGIVLSIPRLIYEGTLPGPASRYVDEAAEAAWRALRSENYDRQADSDPRSRRPERVK